MNASPPTPDAYWQALERVLPTLAAEQQRVALTLYRTLAAKGQALSVAEIARAAGLPETGAREALAREPLDTFVFRDGERVAGFGGLATAPMHHELRVRGRTLWTWCAWDSLFIPALLGAVAEVTSSDPESGERVHLGVSPHRVEHGTPADAVVSFPLPDAESFDRDASNVMAGFCHHVFFFASRASGERWGERHPGLLFYPLDEAFALGQWLLARQFGHALRQEAAA